MLGFFKGTSKGVLGLVLRPTGGIIDLTTATLTAVQRYSLLHAQCGYHSYCRTTQVGDYEISQLRNARFIGKDKVNMYFI